VMLVLPGCAGDGNTPSDAPPTPSAQEAEPASRTLNEVIGREAQKVSAQVQDMMDDKELEGTTVVVNGKSTTIYEVVTGSGRPITISIDTFATGQPQADELAGILISRDSGDQSFQFTHNVDPAQGVDEWRFDYSDHGVQLASFGGNQVLSEADQMQSFPDALSTYWNGLRAEIYTTQPA